MVYDGKRLEIGYRIDLLVQDSIVMEIKSVDAIAPIHRAQLLSYLKLSGKPWIVADFQRNADERWHRADA